MGMTEKDIKKAGNDIFGGIKGRCEGKLPHMVELEV
jgi:hypothetical protein